MLVRISSNVLRACATLGLILGIVLWSVATRGALVLVHMLLGILVVIALWILGYVIATAPRGKNIGLAIGAFVLGLLQLLIGLTQTGSLYLTPSTHWIIQVVHLLFGLAAIGIGEAIAARYKRSNKVAQAKLQG
ncbi:MAG: hypothetical protein NVSMB44_34030 [Ktedonobacteraceae bacterium]